MPREKRDREDREEGTPAGKREPGKLHPLDKQTARAPKNGRSQNVKKRHDVRPMNPSVCAGTSQTLHSTAESRSKPRPAPAPGRQAGSRASLQKCQRNQTP